MGRWGEYTLENANRREMEDMLEEWDEVCDVVIMSGADLSRVPITCTNKAIQEEWEREEQEE